MKCIVINCDNQIFNTKRELCRKHYKKYYDCGLINKKRIKTGSKFNNLILISDPSFDYEIIKGKKYCEFTCVCGKFIKRQLSSVVSGSVKSCSSNCTRKRNEENLISNILKLNKLKLKKIENNIIYYTQNELEFSVSKNKIKIIKNLTSIRYCNDRLKYIRYKGSKIHSNKYQYMSINNQYVEINCPHHGLFIQNYNDHIGKNKTGCPKCSNLKRGIKIK